MLPSFNTSGPCVPDRHYMLSPQRRLGHVMRLIEEGKFFTLHAGHQTGKTTCVKWLVEHYNRAGRLACAWVDLQNAREEPDPKQAMPTILECLDRALRRDLPALTPPSRGPENNPAMALMTHLQDLSARSSKPVVLFMDEADGLVGEAMVSFLTQIRAGYLDRDKTPFPESVVLVGRKQVRDYATSLSERRAVSWLGSSSPFNITAEAPTLSLFTQADVAELLQQHTDKTGQRFSTEAVRCIYELSQGHPWLVNALADQIVNRDVEDRTVEIGPAHVESAKETLILERRSHIDALIARLREPRVQRVIEPMLLGMTLPADLLDDDTAYVLGLGLCTLQAGHLAVANPIYREVIPRALTYVTQISIDQDPKRYRRQDGRLDLGGLLAAWQKFWRGDGHLAARGFHYREAGPHLMLMAFLQRIVNGGGTIQREYGLGRGALDLLLSYGGERHAIEVKLRRGPHTQAEGVEQLARYLDLLGLSEGWLVILSPRAQVRKCSHRPAMIPPAVSCERGLRPWQRWRHAPASALTAPHPGTTGSALGCSPGLRPPESQAGTR